MEGEWLFARALARALAVGLLTLAGGDPIAARAEGLPTVAVLTRPVGTSVVGGVAQLTQKRGAVSPVRADDAWLALRALVPSDLPVYQPTWLPARFRLAPLPPGPMPYVGVTYVSDQGDLLVFAVGPTNSARPTRVEPVTVHGLPGQLSFSDGSPPIQVTWIENGQLYSVRAERGTGKTTISRDELLKVVANLILFGPSQGAHLPRSGDESMPWLLVVGGLLVVAGLAIRLRQGEAERDFESAYASHRGLGFGGRP